MGTPIEIIIYGALFSTLIGTILSLIKFNLKHLLFFCLSTVWICGLAYSLIFAKFGILSGYYLVPQKPGETDSVLKSFYLANFIYIFSISLLFIIRTFQQEKTPLSEIKVYLKEKKFLSFDKFEVVIALTALPLLAMFLYFWPIKKYCQRCYHKFISHGNYLYKYSSFGVPSPWIKVHKTISLVT